VNGSTYTCKKVRGLFDIEIDMPVEDLQIKFMPKNFDNHVEICRYLGLRIKDWGQIPLRFSQDAKMKQDSKFLIYEQQGRPVKQLLPLPHHTAL
jgi:hypothetical protein